ncbi:MAG: Asp-tRNA(Asn)/Glu-tRNA(Gln) amidotransferase subunit GatA [Anaerolineae bacterium]|nr:Asp-tRNA(Asn)/Glu-tRNA(Gln) amidotransferase subunit GatA [Anaerolineae bacterium]NUQ06134.1 Asp-tRNA(Asn)/Glu-tRNA(Gln) amidotransferase subunit GatA [Anaerolineae bacterium]
MTDLTDLSLSEARETLRRREISAVELTRATLVRIEQRDPTLNAYLTVTGERALKQAEAADRALANGEDRPLLGVPLALKDILSTQGVETTCGSKILQGYTPVFSATVAQRLDDAGAILIGKTNLDEFAMGSSTENSAYGASRNPWDTERVPGGSSGGSAVAVAARLAQGAIGTDTGGSIRLPAAYCGIVGLKPSYGRVSRYGLVAFGSSLDCPGPMGRTVEDVAHLLGVIAGRDPLDSTSMDAPVPDYRAALTGDVKGLRIGVPKEYFVEGIQPEVEAAVRAAISQLEAMGAKVVEISLPNTDYAMPAYYIIAPAEASANLARFDGIRFGPRTLRGDMWATYKATRGEGFGPEVKRRIMLGTYALSAGYYDAYYGKAQQVRTLIKQDFDRAFEQVDVIAAPVSPSTAFKFGANVDDPIKMYLEDVFTIPASLAGVCGISVPCGMDGEHLPIGLQLIGGAFQEATILRAAHAYEQATTWHTLAPG